jgi:hypothetical protein
MTDNKTPPRTFKGLIRWALTPPQAWGVYLLAVLLVWLVSFYAGTFEEDAGRRSASGHRAKELIRPQS